RSCLPSPSKSPAATAVLLTCVDRAGMDCRPPGVIALILTTPAPEVCAERTAPPSAFRNIVPASAALTSTVGPMTLVKPFKPESLAGSRNGAAGVTATVSMVTVRGAEALLGRYPGAVWPAVMLCAPSANVRDPLVVTVVVTE